MSAVIRTLHHSRFLPLTKLALRKRESGLSVSVVIPALNEAATVGGIVAAVRAGLVESHGIVDEIIVIDGASTDGTRRVSEKAGAAVYAVDEIVPGYEVPLGKGSALWKAQFVARGDLIVCVDADILGFDNRFVYGLIGPLLEDPELRLVKAFYRRPFIAGATVLREQGGRITEIFVRPFLAAFMPELARVRQPLSGEYALRRTTMETVPFSSGYGVEVGLLMDIYKRYGLGPIAQVNMGVRRHRNRSVAELGRASFGILQTLVGRLGSAGALKLAHPLSRTMVSPLRDGWEKRALTETDLPAKVDYLATEKSRGARRRSPGRRTGR